MGIRPRKFRFLLGEGEVWERYQGYRETEEATKLSLRERGVRRVMSYVHYERGGNQNKLAGRGKNGTDQGTAPTN